MNIVQSKNGSLNILLAALGSSPTLKVRLFSNNVVIDNDSDLGSVTECSFTGYAAVAPTWLTPALVSGVPTTTPSPTGISFTYSGGSSTVVYGVYLTDSSGSKWFGGTTFPTPVTLSTIVTSLAVYPTYTQESKFTTS